MIGQSMAALSHVTPIRIFPLKVPKQTKPITTPRPQQSTQTFSAAGGIVA